ncbi:class I SAM-dependent methyltransferase [Variovorax terrae]|uniref:SAM-dependent methyltransferase n=1 Tax=Variovorax terrae TaxID=2923278 RepID=A0A9X2APA5_9BURK|nr:SAM-dependent methyltransferase [Variovorax terrae]MCJ0761841.1 SAM-dependent methyltransferase [Variovorax terrae]
MGGPARWRTIGAVTTTTSSLTTALQTLLQRAIDNAGGWIGFDRFMALALYAPGLGYYANDTRKFGAMPSSGSDFVTAPEMTPLFGQTLARQLAQALEATGTAEVWEFGAGSGALALQLLEALGDRVQRYTIVDLSGSLRARQQQALQAHAGKVQWVSELPAALRGVVVGNEVLDAMPVKLLVRSAGVWHERGVALHEGRLRFADRPTGLRPPLEIEGGHDYLTEIHPQAEAFVRTLADRLERGAAFFIDYGFAEGEYYHPQRHMGTLMCHRGHQADADPLADLGLKDITAHVNFTGLALAAQEAGLEVLGYTTQARFLMNCGLLTALETASAAQRAHAHRLIAEHEMGELFKVIGLARGAPWDALGFREGDRTHRL